MGIDGADIKNKTFDRHDDGQSLLSRIKTSPYLSKTMDYARILSKYLAYTVGIALFLIVLTVTSEYWYTPPAAPPPPPPQPQPTAAELQERYAHYPAHLYVLQRLKAPSTADFPIDSPHTVARIGDNRYMVSGAVDSQNSFGAMIRTKWLVMMDASPTCRDYTDYNCWTLVEGPIFE
jgi:hypothetical protein